MAMLAEPRQRKRYNLVPRGKALYEDDSRFGTKMLEKMGWSKGKGLGPKEDGSQDFVRVRYKNDIQGLGFEQRDDQWTQHESSFSGLLKSLNGDKSEGEGNDDRESEDGVQRVGFGFQNDKQQCTKKDKNAKLKQNISGVSLEEKSKQSKARVHYKKFTRGKDLSQYSEKDLANIFGKKAVDDPETAAADFYQQLNNIDQSEDKEEEKVVSENFGGVQTISTGLSVSDYFKMKMTALKNRTTQKNEESGKNVQNQTEDAEATNVDKAVKNKKTKKRIKCGNTGDSEMQPEDQTNNTEDAVVDTPKDSRQKKNKKRSRESDFGTVANKGVGANSENGKETSNSLKRKKKPKEYTAVLESGEYMPKCATDNKPPPLSTTIEGELNGTATAKNCKEKKSKRAGQKLADEPQKEGNFADCSERENVNKQKKKSKKRKIQSNMQDDSANSKVSKKIKLDAVSGSKELIATDNVKDLTLPDLQANLNLFNIYRLSSFCAEKFRNLNLSYFPKSSLPQIEGYGLNQDLQLKIETIKTDEMRITRLWDNTLSKYALMEKEAKQTYQKYVQETIKARKHKQKRPSLHFKTWKRKNAFAIM